ncbi:hypothetical protein [Escherichia coli]|uniref:hypothetical protein n=1 Tax=Escherichia coli TaxID=562 RepID=UPI000D6F336A|nr:hypothetical protein [Escherichia coli]
MRKRHVLLTVTTAIFLCSNNTYSSPVGTYKVQGYYEDASDKGMIGDAKIQSGPSDGASATIYVGGPGQTVNINTIEAEKKLARFTGVRGCKDCNFKFYVEYEGNNDRSTPHPVFKLQWYGGVHEITPFTGPTSYMRKLDGNPLIVELYSSGGTLSTQQWSSLDGKTISFGRLMYDWYGGGHSGTELMGELVYQGKTPAPMITWQSDSVINIKADAKGKWNTTWTVKSTTYSTPNLVSVSSNYPISIGGSEMSTAISLTPDRKEPIEKYKWYKATMNFDISGVVSEPTQYNLTFNITFL